MGSLTLPKFFRAKFTPWGEKVWLTNEWTRAQREGYSVGGILKGRCITEERYGCRVRSFKNGIINWEESTESRINIINPPF